MIVVNTIERSPTSRQARSLNVGGKLAALTGAAGAALSGEAMADSITYVPTSGVVAAQNIPGFSFEPPTTVTPGTLRPPASEGSAGWDVDGDGNVDFNLNNVVTITSYGVATFGKLNPAAPFAANPNGVLALGNGNLVNLGNAAVVGPSQTVWRFSANSITGYGGNAQPQFTVDQPGFLGFRFAFGNNPDQYYYGWASMTIDLAAPGSGYTITQAFYQSTADTAINVGAVPVPEPSSLALLAAGAAGVVAWRARRQRPVAAA